MAEISLAAVLRKMAGFTVDAVLELSGANEWNEPLLSSLKDATKEVEKLKDELSWVQALIKDADSRCISSETQMKWLMKIIETANQIEDAIDIFLIECSTTTADDGTNINSRSKRSLFRGNLRKEKSGSFPKKIPSTQQFLNKFQETIQNIMEKVSLINKNRMDYMVDEKVLDSQSDSGALDLGPINDPEVVGFEEDVKNIVKNLCDKNVKSLAVVSIVGPGGIGKTTLAQKAYYSEQVRTAFDKPAWITISQKYDLFVVLRSIAEAFDIESTGLDLKELADKIARDLKDRQYLIILDDVWTNELCDQLLTKVLPDSGKGSRVLITTRLALDVARNADTTYEPYELKCLNDENSLELFLKNAIPKSQQNFNAPNLEELSKKFIKKCKGLPIALICLGHSLSTRDCSYHEWNKFLTTMSWQDDGIGHCSKVLATSFEHLPFARKFSFMYFAAFPQDQDIEAQPLLQMWSAEGLIPPESRRTLVETAECILEDFVQRSMVQVSERYPDGSIKYLRLHDILRDLAVQKAKESNFLMICNSEDDWYHCRMARRVAVHYSDFNQSMRTNANSNLRSLLIFGESKLDCSNYKLLRVLANVNEEVELLSFEKLPHLKYLQLNSKGKITSDFENWIKTMDSLETLSLRSAFEMQNFEGTFSILNKLKHLEIKSTQDGSGSELQLKENMFPPHLLELHLQGFEFNSDPMPVLEKLGRLKILKISSSNKSLPLQISCSDGGFKQLEKLTLENIKMLNKWEFESGALPQLIWLNVFGCEKVPVVPSEIMHRQSLRVSLPSTHMLSDLMRD